MRLPTESPRVRGALTIVAELEALALECAHSGAWHDELSVRRRRRDEAPPAAPLPAEVQVKAL